MCLASDSQVSRVVAGSAVQGWLYGNAGSDICACRTGKGIEMKRPRMAFRAIITALAVLAASTSLLHADLLRNEHFLDDISWNPSPIDENWVASIVECCGGSIIQTDLPDPRFVEFTMDEDTLEHAVLTLEQQVGLPAGTYRLSFQFSATSPPSESDRFEVFARSADFAPEAEMTQLLATNHGVDVNIWDHNGYIDFTTLGSDVTLGFRLVRETGDQINTRATLNYAELTVVPAPGGAVLGCLGLGYAGLRFRRQRGKGK